MKILFALLLTIALAAAVAACGDDDDDSTPTPTLAPTGDGTETPAPTVVENVCAANPDPATDDQLLITTPEPGAELESPFTVSGEAPEFEGRVWFRAYDADAHSIFDQGGSTNFGHLAPEFEEEIEFSVSEETAACLEVYLLRPTEGGITDMVQVPVVLLPAESSATATQTAPEVENVCPDNPDPATEEQVVIEEPPAGDRVLSPIIVAGVAAAFEAAIQLTLLDAEGNVIADQPGMTQEGQTLAPFQQEIGFEVEAETNACLQVYMLSPEDGEPIDIAQIPLLLLPASD
jgi:hypothetical protein